MLHNGRENPTSVPYRGKWPDERIFDLNFSSDDHRSSDRAFDYLTIFPQADPSTRLAFFVDLSEKLPLDPFVQYDAVGGQKVVFFPSIQPPTIQLMA